MLVGGCHAIDALRWFAAAGQFEAATPVEVFAVSGGYRKGSRREYQPQSNTWIDGAPPMEYDGLEVALVKFDNGVAGQGFGQRRLHHALPVSAPHLRHAGTVLDNRLWSHKFPGQSDWIELPTILPDSSNVSHHPFQAEIDHFSIVWRHDRESHCNLEDAIKTHEIALGALGFGQVRERPFVCRCWTRGRRDGEAIRSTSGPFRGQLQPTLVELFDRRLVGFAVPEGNSVAQFQRFAGLHHQRLLPFVPRGREVGERLGHREHPRRIAKVLGMVENGHGDRLAVGLGRKGAPFVGREPFVAADDFARSCRRR